MGNRLYLSVLMVSVLVISAVPPVSGGCKWSNPIPQGNRLFGVWVHESGTYFAVGMFGTVVRWDGANFRTWQLTDNSLLGVWGADPSDVHAVGVKGSAFHFDGTSWSRIPVPTSLDLNCIWGAASDDIYCGGLDGKMLHWNGELWEEMPNLSNTNLQVIWGFNSTDIYAAGSDQPVYRYDGSHWVDMGNPHLVTPTSIWGSSPSDLYVAGRASWLVHYDGSDWEKIYLPDADIWGLAGENASDIYAVANDGNMLHWDGGSWTDLNKSVPSETIWACNRSPDGELIIAGDGIYRWEGANWSYLSQSATDYNMLSDIFCLSNSEAWVVGYDGAAAKWNGSGWTKQNAPTDIYLKGVWASSSDDVWISGAESSVAEGIVMHFDGFEWADMTPQADMRFGDIWGLGPDDVYVLGSDTVFHWNGSNWESYSDDTDIETLWGTPEAGLYGIYSFTMSSPHYTYTEGFVYQWNGLSWDRIFTCQKLLKSIWGTGPDNIYTAGSDTLYHFNGTDWTGRIVPNSSPNIDTAMGFGSNSIYCCSGSKVNYWDGNVWQRFNLPSELANRAISGTHPDNVFAAGYMGNILQLDRRTGRLGVEIDMPQFVSPGESFHVTGFLHNSLDYIPAADVFFILDIYGELFFWDDWTHSKPLEPSSIDYVTMAVEPGITSVIVVPQMTWPDGEDLEVHDLFFYGGMVNPDTGELIGDFDAVEWGYSL